ncbi:MAG: thiosulfate oxidation carrier complex protein SoxZ [Beijerinckiaceae bacterium]|nr:thiosulfate oxidation carrier complex protein SoxZ [Beijerinckiaceae bacterium]
MAGNMGRALISLPAKAKRGDVIEIRAMIAHPMETGFRPDSQGRLVARDIVNRFECLFEGEQVFACDLFPAMSANPYLSFTMRADMSGELVFRWRDDSGALSEEKRRIEVE